MNRKHFLKSVLGASAFLGIPFNSYSFDNNSIEDNVVETEQDNLENSSDDEKKQDI